MTRDTLIERRAKLQRAIVAMRTEEAEHRQAAQRLALDIAATDGAMQECDYWAALFDAQEITSAVTPSH